MAKTLIPATGLMSSFRGGWGSTTLGEKYDVLAARVTRPRHVRVGKGLRCLPKMKNDNEGKGVFAPLVILARNLIGTKRFNQLRGKAIALHSQVSSVPSKPLPCTHSDILLFSTEYMMKYGSGDH